MEIQIFSKNVALSPVVESYIRQKVEKLVRHLPSISEGKVEIVEEKAKSPEHRHSVQITLTSGGILLRSEEKATKIRTAVDKAVKALDRQIERYKGKLYQKSRGFSIARHSSLTGGMVGEESETEHVEELPRVVRVKRFAMKPMSTSEAVEQMELLGHSFFLFLNSETNSINLLYRRNDGNYGLIEPELS
jgi:putative sigma-54 modulation protein